MRSHYIARTRAGKVSATHPDYPEVSTEALCAWIAEQQRRGLWVVPRLGEPEETERPAQLAMEF